MSSVTSVRAFLIILWEMLDSKDFGRGGMLAMISYVESQPQF